MEEIKVAYVTKIKGQRYGHDDKEKIIISFHDDTSATRYNKIDREKTKIYGPYHLDFQDVEYLHNTFPNYFYSVDDPYYEGTVIDWGYDFEEGLYLLMKEEKLILPREKHDSSFQVSFKWIGEPWEPEKQRKLKRKFPKRPIPKI
jgi:hypothetical protein